MSILSKKYFHNEEAAIKQLEKMLGTKCPKCQGKSYKLKGEATRVGLRKCNSCRKQFTVKVGTIFESSHIPLHKWLQACYLMSASKKGISAHQLHRILEITYKSAWFMCHRIREAMKDDGPKLDGIVEVDETYAGGKGGKAGRGGGRPQVMALVERGGKVKAIKNTDTLKEAVFKHVDQSARIITDEYNAYKGLGMYYEGGHDTVSHGNKEYVRGDAHTNTAEGFFGILKRGIVGVYHHISEQHLEKYLAEFSFRYNRRMYSDLVRADMLIAGVSGKRLRYREALPNIL